MAKKRRKRSSRDDAQKRFRRTTRLAVDLEPEIANLASVYLLLEFEIDGFMPDVVVAICTYAWQMPNDSQNKSKLEMIGRDLFSQYDKMVPSYFYVNLF